MGLVRWFRERGSSREDSRVAAWRESWNVSATAFDASAREALGRALDELGLPEEEIEIEREMIDALDRLGALTASVRNGGLPEVVTGHRVIGSEACHFSAPASMPDEPSQPGGRLLLTPRRAVFAGGAAVRSVAWHAAAEVVRFERDLVLMRREHGTIHRFRFNTYSDALGAAFVARELQSAGRARPAL